MRNDPILVLSQPRSGSTLVQRLLNASQGVSIMGEHGGALHKIAYAYTQFTEPFVVSNYKYDMPEQELRSSVKLKDDFVVATCGGVRTDRIKDLTRGFFQAIGNPLDDPEVRWGFKEVVTVDVGKVALELFPRCKIVCTVRDPVDCISSIVRTGWWGRDLEWIISDLWLNKFRDFYDLQSRHRERVSVVRYESMAGTLPGLFQWLGLDWTQDHSNVLNSPHVGHGEGAGCDPLSDDELSRVADSCSCYYR